jgi:hypothetical protein
MIRLHSGWGASTKANTSSHLKLELQWRLQQRMKHPSLSFY